LNNLRTSTRSLTFSWMRFIGDEETGDFRPFRVQRNRVGGPDQDPDTLILAFIPDKLKKFKRQNERFKLPP
jgi:hypothetical protein